MGLINNAIPFSLIVWGQTRIASGLASILIATTPFFVVLVAHFLTDDEKIARGRASPVCSSASPASSSSSGRRSWANWEPTHWPQLAVVGAAISYAFAGVYGRRFQRMGVSPLVTANGQLIASSAMLIPLALLVDRPWTLPAPGAQVAAAVIGLGLLSTALAYILFFRLLATNGATTTALVAFLIPVSAILLGVALLGESLVLRQLAGMGFLALGLAVIDGRLSGLPHKKSTHTVAAEPAPSD